MRWSLVELELLLVLHSLALPPSASMMEKMMYVSHRQIIMDAVIYFDTLGPPSSPPMNYTLVTKLKLTYASPED